MRRQVNPLTENERSNSEPTTAFFQTRFCRPRVNTHIFLLVVIFVCVLGGSLRGTAGSISYAYDAGGRLVCVFDNIAGTGVNYNYDPVGNVTSITTATGCQQNTMRTKPDLRLVKAANASTRNSVYDSTEANSAPVTGVPVLNSTLANRSEPRPVVPRGTENGITSKTASLTLSSRQ